ncbi:MULTISPECIES: recombinase family protein [Ruminococcus]|uniref:recombinase family protein n=1 Tax=Ruminococcus TaxID=1263 RepID=UPI00241CEFE3|nr:recombinase family protein [Ruminococcus bicirculans (ex Wegman et al. 2014)]
MRGISVRHRTHHIADKLNEEGVPIPSDYYYAKLGKPNPRRTRHMWSPETVRQILHNYTYLGHLVKLRTRTVSYKKSQGHQER